MVVKWLYAFGTIWPRILLMLYPQGGSIVCFMLRFEQSIPRIRGEKRVGPRDHGRRRLVK